MFTKITRVRANTLEQLTQHCQSLVPLMKKDISNYAPKRYRLWLFHEALLQISLNIWKVKTDLKRYPRLALAPSIASLLDQ